MDLNENDGVKARQLSHWPTQVFAFLLAVAVGLIGGSFIAFLVAWVSFALVGWLIDTVCIFLLRSSARDLLALITALLIGDIFFRGD